MLNRQIRLLRESQYSVSDRVRELFLPLFSYEKIIFKRMKSAHEIAREKRLFEAEDFNAWFMANEGKWIPPEFDPPERDYETWERTRPDYYDDPDSQGHPEYPWQDMNYGL